nr:uncharacterized protein LOC129420650 [Misgurnus anguillicaudatus]
MANNLLLNSPSTSLTQAPSTTLPLTSTPATTTRNSSSSSISSSSTLCSPSLLSPSSVHTVSGLQPASAQTGTPLNFRTGPALSRLFQPYVNIRSSRARHRLGPTAWEHDFYCMANPSCNTIPTPEENNILKLSGLGKKRVRFEDMNGSFADFTRKIVEMFPAIQMAGAFKVMRSARGRQLVDIPMPPEGYSIPYLRMESGLNKAVAYIVPIQNSIPVVRQEDIAENVVMERCNTCLCEVPLHRLEEHVHLCTDRSSAQGEANEGTRKNYPCPAFKFRVALLLDHNMVTLNSKFATKMKKIDVPCDMPEADLKDLLWKTFPELNYKDFSICRVDRFRRVSALTLNTLSPVAIRKDLDRSALYLRPKEPLELSKDSVSSDTPVGNIASGGSKVENVQLDSEEEEEDMLPVDDISSEGSEEVESVLVNFEENEDIIFVIDERDELMQDHHADGNDGDVNVVNERDELTQDHHADGNDGDIMVIDERDELMQDHHADGNDGDVNVVNERDELTQDHHADGNDGDIMVSDERDELMQDHHADGNDGDVNVRTLI